MIGHLSGKIIARHDSTLIIDVSGVGYNVNVSIYTFGKRPLVDSFLKAASAKATLYLGTAAGGGYAIILINL